VSNIFGPGCCFAVAKIINVGNGEWSYLKVFEIVSLSWELDALHVPFGNTREELKGTELSIGDRGTKVFREFTCFNNMVEDGGDVINVNMVS